MSQYELYEHKYLFRYAEHRHAKPYLFPQPDCRSLRVFFYFRWDAGFPGHWLIATVPLQASICIYLFLPDFLLILLPDTSWFPISLSIPLSISQLHRLWSASIHRICLSICLSVQSSVCLSVCLSNRLSVCVHLNSGPQFVIGFDYWRSMCMWHV